MKKTLKNIVIVFLSVLFAAFLGLGVACSSKKDVSFADFKEGRTEVSAVLGEKYTLDLSSKLGSDGNYYAVSGEVVDSEGDKIEILGGRFLVERMDGYTATYTLRIDEKNSLTRTEDIKVVNNRAPNVVFGEASKTYKIGSTFTFPEITITDLSGESIAPVIQVLDSAGNELAFDAATKSFACEEVGAYTLKITATNVSNRSTTSEFSFFVRSNAENGEYESFGDAGSVYDVKTSGNVKNVSWLAEEKGREGVVKIDLKQTNNYLSLFKVFSKENAAFYNQLGEDETFKNKYVVYSMYVETVADSIKNLRTYDAWGSKTYEIGDVKYNMWFDYVLPAKDLLNGGIDEFLTKTSTGASGQGWFKGTLRADTTVYLDRIAFVESLTTLPDAMTATEFTLGETIAFNDQIATGGQKLHYTVLIDGKPVAYTENEFKPVYANDHYTVIASDVGGMTKAANKTYSFKVNTTETATVNDYSTYVEKGMEYVAPALTIKNGAEDITSQYKMTTEVSYLSLAGIRTNNTNFSTVQSGVYDITLKAEKGASKFIKTVQVEVGPKGADEVIYVDRADALSLYGGQLSKAIAVNSFKEQGNVEDYQGANVVKFSNAAYGSNELKFNFTPVHSATYYNANFTHATLPVYITTNEKSVKSFNIKLLGVDFTAEVNEWAFLTVNISEIVSALQQERLYPLVTWADTVMRIAPTEGSIQNKSIEVYFGDFTCGKQAFNPKLFTATEETYKNVSVNGDGSGNELLDGEKLAALNMNGTYEGTSAVMLNTRSAQRYALSGISAAFTKEINDYKYVSVNLAFYKKEGTTPDKDHVLSFNDASADGQFAGALFSKANGFGSSVCISEKNAGKYAFNTWYTLTIETKKLTELLTGGNITLFALYWQIADYATVRDNYKIIIGDIEVHNDILHDYNGDNYVDEDYFS